VCEPLLKLHNIRGVENIHEPTTVGPTKILKLRLPKPHNPALQNIYTLLRDTQKPSNSSNHKFASLNRPFSTYWQAIPISSLPPWF